MTNKVNFNLVFPDYLTKKSDLVSTDSYSYDQLVPFQDDKDKLEKILDENLQTELKVDYSNFSNHVFFDSAVDKFNSAKKRVLNDYPYNGSTLEKYEFRQSSSFYQWYIFEQWPKFVGYSQFNGTSNCITASDYNNSLLLGTSSLCISAWIKPVVATENILLEVLSASSGPTRQCGYRLYLSGALNPHIKFSLYSGSTTLNISSSYSKFTSSWNNVGVIYDQPTGKLSLFITGSEITSSVATFNSFEFTPRTVCVGTGTLQGQNFYSGSLTELRVLHTSSADFLRKNIHKQINSEDFVKLYYKFKEGIVGTGSIDSVVIDYSKNSIHGHVAGYSSDFRVSGSVMKDDFVGEPILYSFHSGVMNFTSSFVVSASLYDKQNKNYILRLIPEGVLDSDNEEQGLLTYFALGMARYFDDIKLYIDQFDNLKTVNYTQYDQCPDQFLPFLSKYFGWKAGEHFSDVDPLSFIFGENVLITGSLSDTLQTIRNEFWKRTLNNLPYLLKTKGTRYGIDSYLNTLGINKYFVPSKEYGVVRGSSITDNRIHKEKPIAFLGIGTGSLSSSYIKVPSVVTTSNTQYTIECVTQLPFGSASYSSSVINTTGSIWQLVDLRQVTGSIVLAWNTKAVGSATGTLFLSASDGRGLRTSNVYVFDGQPIHVAAGRNSVGNLFIELRRVENGEINYSASFTSSLIEGLFTASKYDFVIGATSGSAYHKLFANGYFSEFRYWDVQLSSSELDIHALHHESVGVKYPLETSHLKGHWPLNDNNSSDSSGLVYVNDYSRNSLFGSGSGFLPSSNLYKKFLIGYDYLSPNFDLNWVNNKVRVRNLTELNADTASRDSSEFGIEFNLVDALNEDISKIFSSFDVLNDVIGKPVNKYREEYSDLESYRKVYFERLGDGLNFTKFFKLFKWFDKKFGDSIKALLPVNTKFIGAEQVVESHMLERPRVKFKYAIFKTPKEVGEAPFSSTIGFTGSDQKCLCDNSTIKGTRVNSIYEDRRDFTSAGTNPRDISIATEFDIEKSFKNQRSVFGDGEELGPDKNKKENKDFYRTQYSGDTKNDIFRTNSDLNSKNELAKKELLGWENKNYPNAQHTGVFICLKYGEPLVTKTVDSTIQQSHWFGGNKKFLKMKIWGLTASYYNGSAWVKSTNQNIAGMIALTGANGTELSQSLFDEQDYYMTATFTSDIFGIADTTARYIYNPQLSYYVSCSNAVLDTSHFSVEFKDGNSVWNLYKGLNNASGSFTAEKDSNGNNTGWQIYRIDKFYSQEQSPIIKIGSDNVHFRLSSSAGKTYVFKNIKLEFLHPLSNVGVEKYLEYDNQNINNYYYNFDVLKKVE